MEQIMEYIKPELLVLIPVLYLLGAGLKNAKAFRDEMIPVTLGACGVALSALWLVATEFPVNGQAWAMLVFTALVQGVLVAGAAVYANQIVKQHNK